MSLPPGLRSNFNPLELEFVVEETLVEIIPSVRLPKTRLLSGVSLAIFEAGGPIERERSIGS